MQYNSHLCFAATRGDLHAMSQSFVRDANCLNEAASLAAMYGHASAVKWCAERGATYFDEAMGCGAQNGFDDVVNSCIDLGANDFKRALGAAALYGHIHIMQTIVIRSGLCEADNFTSACINASASKQTAVILWLLEETQAKLSQKCVEYWGELLPLFEAQESGDITSALTAWRCELESKGTVPQREWVGKLRFAD